MFSQILLAILSILAIALTQLTDDPRITRWAPVLGLASQPFWLHAGLTAQQYGNLTVTFVVTLVWCAGIYRAWWRKPSSKKPHPQSLS